MPEQDLLNKKTIYSLTTASAICYAAVGIFNDIYNNTPPFKPVVLVLALAMLVSIGAALKIKAKKDINLFLAVLMNTILITTSALGFHGYKQSEIGRAHV